VTRSTTRLLTCSAPPTRPAGEIVTNVLTVTTAPNAYNTTFRVRSARKWHLCDSCHFLPSLRGVATIAPGHLYVIHVAFPGADGNESGRVITTTECLRCMNDRIGYNDVEWHTKACGTFCCGDTACVRRFDHWRLGETDPGHSCHRCTEAPAKVVTV
jgi:hypothetical protein